jgi:hypothetical protein
MIIIAGYSLTEAADGDALRRIGPHQCRGFCVFRCRAAEFVRIPR